MAPKWTCHSFMFLPKWCPTHLTLEERKINNNRNQITSKYQKVWNLHDLQSCSLMLTALSPSLWCLLPQCFASLTIFSCRANHTSPSAHGSDLMNRRIVGRERRGYRSRQIPGQSGHFVWEKDLALSLLGSRSFLSSERSSRQRNKASEDDVQCGNLSNTKVTFFLLKF